MVRARSLANSSLLLLIAIPLLSCSSDQRNPTRSDIDGPRIIATSPSAGATQVPTNSTISVTFDEPIDPQSVIMLFNGLASHPITVTDSIVTMTLSQRMFQKVEYTMAVLDGVKDLAGNTMDSAYQWSFTTGFGPLGESWDLQTSPTTNQLNFVVRGSYDFMAVGAEGTILTSPNGLVWTPSSFHPVADQLWSAFPIGDRFIVTGSPGIILASNEPNPWTQDTLGDSITNLYDIFVSLNGIYMVGTGGQSGTDGLVLKYSSPTNWSSVNLGPHLTPRSITGFGTTLVVVGDSGLVFVSTDGTVWTDHSLGTSWGDLCRVRWSNQYGKLLAVGSAIISSPDGVTWSQHTIASDKLLRDIGWTNLSVEGTTYRLACAVGDSGKVFTSEDAVNWAPQISGVTTDLHSITQGMVPTRFVVVGKGGIILTSE